MLELFTGCSEIVSAFEKAALSSEMKDGTPWLFLRALENLVTWQVAVYRRLSKSLSHFGPLVYQRPLSAQNRP